MVASSGQLGRARMEQVAHQGPNGSLLPTCKTFNFTLPLQYVLLSAFAVKQITGKFKAISIQRLSSCPLHVRTFSQVSRRIIE